MNIKPISLNDNFKGKVIVKNKISVNQNHLFNLHKHNLEYMIKDLPFDLFVEQSKSGKTISLSTNVEGANAYIVRKNKQNFEDAAEQAIEDAKRKSELYKTMVRTNEMLQSSYNSFTNIVTGNFKDAREHDKKLAKLAVNDFENYKNIPKINYINVPMIVQKMVMKNCIMYRIYKMFSAKIPEEKQFSKMRKEYKEQLKKENRIIKTIDIDFRTGKIKNKNY